MSNSSINTIEADSGPIAGKIAVLTTRWNSFITDNLLSGAQRVFARNEIADSQIDIVRVPGAFELPATAQKLVQSGQYAAIVALGCVIRGGTPHFDFVCAGCMDGLMRVQLDSGIPVTFGVLTVDDVEQAMERSAEDPNNKGEEAALTALEMVRLLGQISSAAE